MDLSELYQQELKLLKESSKVFSADYPAITEAMNRDIVDPDVKSYLHQDQQQHLNGNCFYEQH